MLARFEQLVFHTPLLREIHDEGNADVLPALKMGAADEQGNNFAFPVEEVFFIGQVASARRHAGQVAGRHLPLFGNDQLKKVDIVVANLFPTQSEGLQECAAGVEQGAIAAPENDADRTGFEHAFDQCAALAQRLSFLIQSGNFFEQAVIQHLQFGHTHAWYLALPEPMFA